MLEFMTSQYIELAKLDEALSAMRVRYIRAALTTGKVPATNSPESDRETEELAKRIREFYRGKEWKSLFPPDPEESDETAKKILLGSRDMAMNVIILLHKLIMNTPVVGCEHPNE